MTGQHEDPRLRELLSDAVSEVEPQDRLASIRARTATTKSSRRGWIMGTGGAVVATAAVITAIAFAGGNLGTDDESPGPAASSGSDPSRTAQEQPSEEPSTGDSTPPQPADTALPVYYVGDTGQGPRLYREFRSSEASDQLLAALEEATGGAPLDPDYRSPWPQDGPVVESASVDGDVIRVGLTSDSLSAPPQGMSDQEAQLAVQQLVYTAQAVAQQRLPVRFEVDGAPLDQLYGVSTGDPVTNRGVLDTLSLMSITSPTEGATLSGSFTATGANNGFEANVQWQILRDGEVVKDGFTTAAGWMADKLFPWKVRVDVSDLEPGDYVFRAHNDDPTGGQEGSGPFTDTKSITIE